MCFVYVSGDGPGKNVGVHIVRENCLENDIFSRLGKSQGISFAVREI